MESALERAWAALETYFSLTHARIQAAAARRDVLPDPPGAEEGVVRAALAALSYDELCSLLADPRWYEPLPVFERRPRPDAELDGYMRFAYLLCFVPHTPEALRAVLARPHQPPPLPPQPSWTLVLTFRWGEFYARRYFRSAIAMGYGLYPTKCQQFVTACRATLQQA